ncbi:MAG: hypothetical protein H6738_12790 [Alphaproteobacteria bacterium]|nr:hypothetical protein [Alphaproteobacteria bacterium]MCB9697651.1 hypothetical protein [Alphaproteobacteria bacterium]
MDRVHLFEIEDQPWCPALIRDGCTAYITRFCHLTGRGSPGPRNRSTRRGCRPS